MNKVVAIAPDYQHIRNYCESQDLPLERIIFADRIEKLRGQPRGFAFIYIDKPYDRKLWREIELELRIREANELSLEINEWPLDIFA